MPNAVSGNWPSGSDNNRQPQEPTAMLMPGRVEGYPSGTQRAANAAERLLTQAVAYWDVGQYRDGDRFLRNRGTGGELLDLRLGSAAVANSNDPLYLAPEDSGYVYLPGVTGNYLSVPDEAALDITGDIDIRVRVALDDWTPADLVMLAAKYGSAGNRSWGLLVNISTGTLTFRGFADGTTLRDYTSTVGTGLADGAAQWVRATLDVDDGAGNSVVKFWLSDDGASWTQLGSTVTSAGTTSLYASTAILALGSRDGASNMTAGRVYRAQILNGIDGTTVLDIDCDAITSGSDTSFTAVTNQTVTISRGTSGRKAVAVPSRSKGGRPVMLLGTDDFLECVDNWQHGLLNFTRGDSFTIVWVGRQWATQPLSSLIAKKTALNLNNGYALYFFNGEDAFIIADGSLSPARAATVTLGSTATIVGVRDTSADTVQFFYNGTGTATTTDTTTATLANSEVLRVGRLSGTSTSYGDFEFYAAAIFRRALSADEIKTISDYYTEKKSIYDLPSKAEQTTFIANQLGLNETTASSVLNILSDATLLYDAKTAKSGDRYIKNLGINRDTLNARYGSSQSTNSQDPLYLAPDTAGYVYLTGVLGNSLSTPDQNAVDVTGDIDLRARVALDDWTPSAITSLISRWDTAGQRSYQFRVETDGKLSIQWSPDGNNIGQISSASAPTVQDGSPLWVRATLDVDNGASGRTATFYTSPDDGLSWVQLGGTVTQAASTSIWASTSLTRFGTQDGTNFRLSGKFYAAQIWHGIEGSGGTKVLDIDCNAITSGSATSFTAATGQTVTINRSTTGMKSVAMPSASNNGSPLWLLGSNDYFEVDSPFQNDLLNVNPGESITVLAVHRFWNRTSAPQHLVSKGRTQVQGFGSDVGGWAMYIGPTTFTGTRLDISGPSNVPLTGPSATDAIGTVNATAISASASHAQARNLGSVRIGRGSNVPNAIDYYLDGEIYAVAVWRRLLTSTEITTLSNYFNGRIA